MFSFDISVWTCRQSREFNFTYHHAPFEKRHQKNPSISQGFFLREHQDGVLEVGGDFLAKKGLDFNTWSTSIVGNFMPLDELGLLCLARLWHRHFAVILKDFIWTTGIGIALEDCCVVFAYCGGFLLRDTVEINSLMHLPLYQTLYGTTDQENALDLSANRPTITENGASNLDSVNMETSGETSANLDCANLDSASVLNNKENGINVQASKPNVTYITIVLVSIKSPSSQFNWSIQTLISGGDSSCSWVFCSCTGPQYG